MRNRLETGDAALRANAECFCFTLDRELLARKLETETGSEGFGIRLAGSHPYLFANSPVFLAPDSMNAMKAVVAAVEMATALPPFRAAVLEWAPQIAADDFGPVGALMGYDFHLTEAGPVLIEVNTNAGGAFLNAALARAQRACCFETAKAVRPDETVLAFEERIGSMFASEWKRQGRSGKPSVVAIVDDEPDAQFLHPEFLLAKTALERQGIQALILDPRALTRSASGLSFDGLHIDLVYNRLVDFAFKHPDHASLRSAYLKGLVVVTPNPHVHALYADKRNLSLLSDSLLLTQWELPLDAVNVLDAAVPQTTIVTAENAETLWADRRNLFFKPAGGYGSKATYSGAKLTRKVWTHVTAGGYIAQTYAPPSIRRVERDGEVLEMKVDVRLYTYDGTVLLTAARLYRGQTTNMRTPGGGFAPVLEIAR
ncbi:hypothetical protein A9995_06985 [Erythrobacter sp. QSSC1-22B]|uniref:hypothetical protein n=1 Tax=Erythrobacter sp. QSSC1-22B TaxID=1860125 RepID=UPI00080591D8|nr:hypothetical protein [Erythrobacter sp. QSSC1-22B]OBX19489.1 hypothetical protein A9995_06985 [Erythrobacter sp. QSSC1-22B]